METAPPAHARDAPDCSYVPVGFGLGPETMASDGFHPGAPIYGARAAAIAAVVRERRRLLAGSGD